MLIKSFPYNEIKPADKTLLDNLLKTVWEDIDTMPLHPREMDARSFCAVEGHRFVGYTGVLSWGINVGDCFFRMGGLSCVCVHPQCRRQGIGHTLVRKATDWMSRCGKFDIGLFTCSSENTLFYESAGAWERSPNLVLKESDREGAYVSSRLRLDVFKLLISQKAVSHAFCFDNTILTLYFPAGKFV